MKKGLLFAVAALAMSALSANAADYYLIGDFDGWALKDANAKFTDAGDGTYTLEMATLTSGFKINDGTWNNGNANWGSNGSTLTIGETYNLSIGGSTGNINFTENGAKENVKLVFNPTAATLLVTGQAKENTYDNVYLVGDINGGGWNTNISTYPLNLKEGTENTWVGEYEITANSWFKLRAGDLIYGTGGDDIAVENGVEYTGKQGDGNSFAITPGKYTFTYVLDKNADEGKLTVTGEAVVTYPETMYILGNVNGADWAANNSVAMTAGENGVFTAKEVLIGTAGDGYGYFSFAQNKPEDNNWDALGTRWSSATAGGSEASLTEPNAIIVANDNAFKVPEDQNYDITVDLANMTMTVVLSANQPELAPAAEVVKISCNVEGAEIEYNANWGEWEITGSTEGDKVTLTFDLPAKYGELWYFNQAEMAGDRGDVEPLRVNPEEEGWYPVAMMGATKLDGNTVSFNLTGDQLYQNFMILPSTDGYCNPNNIITVDLTISKVYNFPEHVYVVGTIEGDTNWGAKFVELENKGNGLYENEKVHFTKTNEAGDTFFSFTTVNTDDWSNKTRYGAATENEPVVPNSGNAATVVAYPENVSAIGCLAFQTPMGTYKVTLDLKKMTLLLDGKVAVDAIEVEEGEAQYFNLQGVRVAKPENGIFVRVLNGKAAKVVK